MSSMIQEMARRIHRFRSIRFLAGIGVLCLAASCKTMEVYTQRKRHESPIVVRLKDKVLGVMPVRLRLGGVRRTEKVINITWGDDKVEKDDRAMGKVWIWTDSLWREAGADARLLAQELSDHLMNRLISEEPFWTRLSPDGAYVLSTAEVELDRTVMPVRVSLAADAAVLPNAMAGVVPVRKVKDATVDYILEVEVELGWDVVEKREATAAVGVPWGERQPAQGNLFLMWDYNVSYRVIDTLTGKEAFTETRVDPYLATLNGIGWQFLAETVSAKSYPAIAARLPRDWLEQGRSRGKAAIDGVVPMFRPVYSQVIAYREPERADAGKAE